MLYKPVLVLFWGWVVFGVILTVAPLEIRVSISLSAILFLVLCFLSFWLGSVLANSVKLRGQYGAYRLGPARETRLFYIFAALGLFGVLFRLIDRYVIRGAGGLSAIEAREALIDTSTSTLGLFGAVFFPFCFIPLMMYFGSPRMGSSRLRLLIAFALAAVPALDALTVLSRSLLIVLMAMLYFAVSLGPLRGRLLSARIAIPSFIGVLLLGWISSIAFASRLDQMQIDLLYSILNSAYAHTVVPNYAAQDIMTGGGDFANAVSGTIPLAQYYVHGVFEFELLWNRSDDQVFSWGALLLGPYVKVMSILGLVEQPDVFELFPRVGTFTTFYGPLWVDFGWFSLLIMGVFGFIARLLGRLTALGDIGAFPLYVYICVILFFAPVVNFAISAQGMYLINAFLIFFVMTRTKQIVEETRVL